VIGKREIAVRHEVRKDEVSGGNCVVGRVEDGSSIVHCVRDYMFEVGFPQNSKLQNSRGEERLLNWKR
jgi:hypothetical protein